ncbi:hypothetical protein [Streptomyces sp. VRA16 Mangrove soil]|uniref:ATP-binding protein n=1 Tax=Streptomyces sp. VRA16 Mangrove soil TaxID=2817434 RepID=UPI001A9D2D64|nr:hypothetical protein [Streptomyces sp. VRA16 Mangrove soil]MBO1336930.1 hypothetical protein [Streptomyces sp. VRA16 Mangrove soil]
MTTEVELPAETTSFVGRVRELDDVVQLLRRERLVTLTGVGGVGKTRLAVRAAARAAVECADGARFVALTPLRDPSLLGHQVLEDLRLADPSVLPPEDVVVRWLADKELLLVLDSCEHVVDASARLVRTLLDAAPGLRVLATSRQPLSVPGEVAYEVDPLPVPAPPSGPDGPVPLRPGDAVELFAERAAAVVEGFELLPADHAAAAAVVRRVDGIPLAVELAAAQLGELEQPSVYRLNDRLQHRFETLIAQSGNGGATLPRHRTLRTTIGWSHELCTPLERLLWARLSVFTGGFDLVGARAVGSGGPLPPDAVARVLSGLVTKSLVRGRADGPFPERFTMLDTVREYGVHWLFELGEETEARARHRDFYRDLARQADAEWIGPDQVPWHRRLLAEHANFRTALDFCLTRGEGRAALEIGGSLWMMWFAFGYAREGAHYLDLALDMWRTPGPERAKALWARGLTCVGLGDFSSMAALAPALRTCVGVGDGDDPTVATALCYLRGIPPTLTGDMPTAAALFDTLPHAPHSRGAYPEAWFVAIVARAFVRVHQGDFAAAEEVAAAAAVECERRGEQWMHSYVAYVRALAAAATGRPAEAARHARTALAGKALFRDSIGIATTIDALAGATAGTGDPERAARLLGIAHRVWQTLGRPQLGAPELVAARADTERAIRAAIGDAVYDSAFAAGLAMPPGEGVAHCLT